MNRKSIAYSGILLLVLILTSVVLNQDVVRCLTSSSHVALATSGSTHLLGQEVVFVGSLDFAAGERILVPTFRIPTLIHTRSANSQWLNEISHRHPLWVHPGDAEELGIEENGLVRITTRIGHFVISAWRTEGIRPGVGAASHHMGRWRLDEDKARSWGTGKASIDRDAHGRWRLRREHGNQPYDSDEPDTGRIWWTDTGVHQNLTHPVQPDPISGAHCWLQKVRLTKPGADEKYGDIEVDTDRSFAYFKKWNQWAKDAETHPNGLRRPLWMRRPLTPARDQFYINK